MTLHRSYALITGASEGLGKNFVIECAKRQVHIVAVALPGPGLEAIRTFTEKNFPVQVITIAADISTVAGCREVRDTLDSLGISIRLLINNAGVVVTSPFEQMPVETCAQLIEVNALGMTLMTRFVIDHLLENTPSYILNVGSLGGYFALPYKQVYSASKSYVYALSRSLRAEYRNRGISVTVVCPGGLSSNLRSALNNRCGSWLAQQSITSPEYVAAKALRACLAGRAVCTPGLINSVFLWFGRLLPTVIHDRITTSQMHKLMGKTNHTLP